MVDPGRSPRAVYLHTWTSRMRQNAPRLLRIFAFVLTTILLAPIQAAGQQNVDVVWSNDAPLGGYSLGDFNGDGITDLFRVVGTQWQYSASGTGPWINLATDATPQSELRFGDFNGDGTTDVFHKIGTQWRYSASGTQPWANLAMESVTPLNDLRFGDFNGDNITDVFTVDTITEPGRWRYSPGGASGYIPLQIEPSLNVNDLRFGYFDNDDRIDVFNRRFDGEWRYSSGGTGVWNYDLAGAAEVPYQDIALGDFDGDGITDVFNRQPSGQWRFSRSGTDGWVNLNSEPGVTLPNMRFGDFNGDGRTDVFSIGPSGIPRYSSGATGPWQDLTPGLEPTPTHTATVSVTPTPTVTGSPPATGTPTATGSPTPTPEGCRDILYNGDFEFDGGWTFGNSPVPGKYTGVQRRSGLRSVQLGIPPEMGVVESYSSIRQLVTVPANTSTVTLRWWQWAFSDEGPNLNPGSFQDRLDVVILSPGGDTLRVVSRTRRIDGGWQQGSVDLTEFAGQSFYVYFNLYNDGNGARSWIFLDDMMLEACPGSGPMHGGPGRPGDNMGWGGPQHGGPGKPGMGGGPCCEPPRSMADLELSKSVNNITATVGSNVVFTVVVTNTGPGDATGVSVKDELPSGFTFVSSSGGYDTGSGIWTIGNLANGASATLVITGTFSQTGEYTNYAQVWSSHQSDPDSVPCNNSNDEDDDATAVVTVITTEPVIEADLSLTKVVSNSEPGVGGTIVYTIVVTNSGPSVANGVTVSDTLPSVLTNISSTGGYMPSTGIWTVGTLAVNMSDTLEITATLPVTAFGLYTNYAQVWTSSPPDDPDSDPGDDSMTDDDDGIAIINVFTPTIDVTGTSALPAQGDIALAPALQAPAALPPAPLPQAELAQPVSTPAPALPTECREVLENGDFEVNGAGWTVLQGLAAPLYTSEQTFNGSGQAMRLGIVDGDNLASISAIDQVIALPSEANSIILSFRYYPLYEPEPGPGDLQYVDVYNVLTGQFAGRALGTQSNERSWLTVDYDLTMQAGQTIRLVLAVNNDGVEGRSAMYVDNVSIMACNFGDLVAPGDAPTRDPALSSSSLAEREPILLAGRQQQASPGLMARLSAIGVLASVAGVIGFAVMVVLGTMRRP